MVDALDFNDKQPIVYGFSAALILIAVRLVMRAGDPTRRPLVRVALLSVLLLAISSVLLWVDCSARAAAFLAAVVCVASISLREEQTQPLVRAFGRASFAVYITSVFTVGTLVYIHLPVMTFLTSRGEIGVHLEYLFTINLRGVMVVTYLAAALFAFALSPRMKAVLAFLATALLSLALLYSFAYPFGYPRMSGLTFERIPIGASELAFRTLVDVTTVAIVVPLTLVAVLRLQAKKTLLAIGLVNVSLAAAFTLRVARDATAHDEIANEATSAPARPIKLGKGKRNVLILFLDRFMGGFVEEILKQEPQLASDLEGFVWYPRTLAAGENSIAGLHPLLGGYDYTPREMNARNRLLRDLSVESYSILPYNFTKSGYAVNLVNPRGLGFTIEGDCSFFDIEGASCSHIPATVTKRLAEKHGVPMQDLSQSSYADLLVLLGLMRVTPYVDRAVLHERGPWKPFLDHSAGTTFRQWAELKSLPELSSVDSDRDTLNVFFNILPHEPYFMGEDCVPRPTPLLLPQEEVRRRGYDDIFGLQHFVAARCALLLAADYFRWLRSVEVYDDTKIVVVSDHGIVGPVTDRSSRALAGGTTDNMFVRSRSLLLVKERGARGPLRTSEAFMPNAEVPRIVCEEIGGCVNPFLNDKPIEAHGRDRPFYVSFVPWQFNLQEQNRFKILREMVLLGPDPYDATSWREVGRTEHDLTR